ncbi:MAG TPA: MlaD family protein [Nocardia sp.]|uniref:MlaD family protein n=1 Tax=Nocardia TaxID=1817 RepID=UPI0024569217|nr:MULTISPECIES: MlaD family protein [Nocardia]HLS76739.1 MlaD family protein [Nocardia sp.]
MSPARRGFPARKSLAAATVAVTLALGSTGCGIGLESVPLPAPGLSSDTYELTAVFVNALNLPDRAKVRLAGGDIGEVADMRAADFRAVVTLRIRAATRLPVGTTAELRSATPLGDVYIALTPPPDAGPQTSTLGDGDTIPVSATTAAATVEEALTTSAMLVNGGAIRDLTTLVNDLGNAVGEDGDRVAALIQQSRELIATLTARSGEITEALTATGRLTATLAAQDAAISESIAAAGPALEVVSADTAQLLRLVTEIDRITTQLARFPSVQGTDTRSVIADMNLLSDVFNQAALNPHADLNLVNSMLLPLIKATSSTSAHADISIEGVAVGPVDDPGHAADPGLRVPDLSDWAAMIGSLEFLLLRLQDRFGGGAR